MTTDNMNMVKQSADVLSVVATVGSWLNVFTPIFGLIGATWTLMRIAEMFLGKPFHELIRRKPKADSDKP
ncbi:MAG: hypothetical protein EB116_14750 [Betaproteobacteria bacterium]|nr:hypothetical protein [Betaproteobacteria bacterium]